MSGGQFFNKHKGNVTAVRFGPKGGRIGSGNNKGDLIVWNYLKENQSVSHECNILSGQIKDIDFTGCNERCAVAGFGGVG